MSDHSSPSQPIFLIPGIIKWLALITVGIHALLEFGPAELTRKVDMTLAYIPLRFAHSQLMSVDPLATLLSPVGYALLHGSWTHVLVNMAMLLALGSALLRQAGSAFFLLVYIIGALAGAASVSLLFPESMLPVIGASAAVSGLMGALIGFALKPIATSAHRQPAFFRTRKQTLTFLVVWVAVNLLFGILPASAFGVQGRIAWEAHLGGLAAGLILGWLRQTSLARQQQE
ncbi:rhomboid family intramembrane serine protease [Aestuariispira insulae]|uniref:Membrane associated rhomboid family serine protease n=1 Tax=Aestuariispira insulae TaxID=1461337 RepID=A0A3D9HK92_9PROT|nr:rhomboid family intramembrane serine protease [Aestuariispira insulae]RED49932.1 membrane associated rhomboid family serine protease [Aestuariispira insulae]